MLQNKDSKQYEMTNNQDTCLALLGKAGNHQTNFNIQ